MARESASKSSAPYICPLCNKKLSSSKHVRRHMETHDFRTKNRFRCPYGDCAYSGRQKSNLNVHIKAIHENSKDIHCPFCKYQSASRSALLHHHKRYHPDVQPRSVSECTSSSSASSSSSTTPTSDSPVYCYNAPEPTNFTFFNDQYYLSPPPSHDILPAAYELPPLVDGHFDWDWFNSLTQPSKFGAESSRPARSNAYGSQTQQAGACYWQEATSESPLSPDTYYSPAPSSPSDCGLHFAPPTPPTYPLGVPQYSFPTSTNTDLNLEWYFNF